MTSNDIYKKNTTIRLSEYQAAVRILQVLLRTGPHISLLNSWSYMFYEHMKMIMIQNAPIPKFGGRNASDNSMHHWSLSLLCPTTTLLHTHQTHRHKHTHTIPAKQISRDSIINVKRFHLAPGLSLSVFLNLSISFKLQASKLGRNKLYINSVSHYTSTFNALIVIHFGTCI